MNGLNQYFQVTIPGIQTLEYSRSIGSQEQWAVDRSQGIIAPGCFLSLLVKRSFFICIEMSAVLDCSNDTDLSSLGKFYPFFILNFPVKFPCVYNLDLGNQSDSPVEYKAVWAKEP
jgi:hypothetical protein